LHSATTSADRWFRNRWLPPEWFRHNSRLYFQTIRNSPAQHSLWTCRLTTMQLQSKVSRLNLGG